MPKKKRMSTHFDFHVVDQDGRWMRLVHFLLYTHSPEVIPLILVLLTQTRPNHLPLGELV